MKLTYNRMHSILEEAYFPTHELISMFILWCALRKLTFNLDESITILN